MTKYLLSLVSSCTDDPKHISDEEFDLMLAEMDKFSETFKR